jgi:hypothetical protein
MERDQRTIQRSACTVDIVAQNKQDQAQSTSINKLVESTIGPALWERLIEPRRWDPTDDVEARVYGLLYRAVYGWTALPAAQPVRADDEIICSCQLREWCETPGKHPFSGWKEDTLPVAPSIEETIRLPQRSAQYRHSDWTTLWRAGRW